MSRLFSRRELWLALGGAVVYWGLLVLLASVARHPTRIGLIIFELLVLAWLSSAFRLRGWVVFAGIIVLGTVIATGLWALSAQLPLVGFSFFLNRFGELFVKRELGAVCGALLGFVLVSLPFWTGELPENVSERAGNVVVFLSPLGGIGSATGEDILRNEIIYRYSRLVSSYRFEYPMWWLVGVVYVALGGICVVLLKFTGCSNSARSAEF